MPVINAPVHYHVIGICLQYQYPLWLRFTALRRIALTELSTWMSCRRCCIAIYFVLCPLTDLIGTCCLLRDDSSHGVLGRPTQDCHAEGGGAGDRGGRIRVSEQYPVQHRLEHPRDPCWIRTDPWNWRGHVLPGWLPGRLPHGPVSVMNVTAPIKYPYLFTRRSIRATHLIMKTHVRHHIGDWEVISDRCWRILKQYSLDYMYLVATHALLPQADDGPLHQHVSAADPRPKGPRPG